MFAIFPWWFYVALVLIVALAIVLAILTPERRPFQYRYMRRKYLMTRAEHECFEKLVAAVGDTYYVFPQIHLSALIDHKVKGQSWKGAFAHINQKSVDFVLCTKSDISPVLAIELDDWSHERSDRIERDHEVERMLNSAGVPLLRLKHSDRVDRSVVESVLQVPVMVTE